MGGHESNEKLGSAEKSRSRLNAIIETFRHWNLVIVVFMLDGIFHAIYTHTYYCLLCAPSFLVVL